MCECSSDDGNGDVSIGVGDLNLGNCLSFMIHMMMKTMAALNMHTSSLKHLTVLLQKEEILIPVHAINDRG